MSVQLKVIGGPHQGKQFEFANHDSFIVGRGRKAHFQLPHDDQYFSRTHFLIEVNPPLCRLLDLGSRNGTKVNNQRVTTVDLRNGDVISAGKTVIEVTIHQETIEPTVIVQSDAVASPQTRASTLTPLSSDGWELLPADEHPLPVSRISDPNGYLPANYLECIRESPQPIAGYHLIRELGHGGMGTVFLAIREKDRSIVALKTIRVGTVANPRDQQRFLREAEILQQLLHPNIVAYRESGVSEGVLFFSMEYIPGIAGNTLVRESGGTLRISRAVKILLQLLAALRYAHTEGFVHRDIKPSNLLVVESPSGDIIKLADFGLARAYQASGLSGLTMTGDVGGTISYLSPEQITDFRHAQPATDQYAAAATLYYLLTGCFVHDFPDDAGKRLLMILDQDPVPIRSRRSDIPKGLSAAIHRALARDAQARFQDVRAFHAAIEPFSR